MSGDGERVYLVEGMTCEHCRAAVAGEVGGLPRVTAVEVDLASGRLAVRGDGVDDAAVAAAVAQAGYRLAA